MSVRVEEIDGHPAHELVETLVGRIRELDAPEEQAEDLGRLLEVLAYAQRILQAADRSLLSGTYLDPLHAALAAVSAAVDNYDATGAEGHLGELGSSLANVVLLEARRIPTPPEDKMLAALAEQVRELRALAQTSVGEWRTANEDIESKVQETDAALEAAKQDLATQTTTFEGQITEFKTATDLEKTRLTEALAEFDTTSAAAVTTAEERFAQAEETRVDAAEQARTELAEQARAAVAGLEQLREQAIELVGTVATTGTAGHFQQVADEQRKDANTWRLMAVVFGLGAVAVGLWSVIAASGDSTLDWQHVGIKALLTLSLGAIAGYAATQSKGHRDQERAARHTELQLKSVEAFLQPLTEEQRAEIRSQLAAHVFGPRHEPSGKGDTPADMGGPAVLGQLATLVADRIGPSQ